MLTMQMNRNVTVTAWAMLLAFGGLASSDLQAGLFEWSGGTSGDWSDSANWNMFSGTDSGSDNIPSGSDWIHISNGIKPNAPHTIIVDGAHTIDQIELLQDGARSFTFSDGGVAGRSITMNGLRNPKIDNIFDVPIFSSALTFSTGFTSSTTTFKQAITTTGVVVAVGTGSVALEGANSFGGGWTIGQAAGNTVEVIVRHDQALGTTPRSLTVTNAGPAGVFLTLDGANGAFTSSDIRNKFTVQVASGDTDRTLKFTGIMANNGFGPNELVLGGNVAGDDGRVRLLFQSLTAAGNGNQMQMPVTTTAGTVFELSGALASPMLLNTISGAGSLLVTGANAASFQEPQTYTGGTTILGRLFYQEINGLGTAALPSLPDTGVVTLAAGATLDLNGFSDAIGGLTGHGSVELGGATLTITEGVSPGSSIGTLSILESGAVVLGSTANSVFEFEQTLNDWDRVLLPGGATLTLGGVLTIESLSGWKQTGEFVLFDMQTTGLVSGGFSSLVLPTWMQANVLTDSNGDVVLNILSVPEPGAAMIVVLGATVCGLLRRRSLDVKG